MLRQTLGFALGSARGAANANAASNFTIYFTRNTSRSVEIHDSRTGAHTFEQDPEKISDAKSKQLRGESEVVIPETEGWSYQLASASEAVVKAEKAPNLPIEEMQKRSVEIMQKGHDEAHPTKTGRDVSHMPGIQDNLHKTFTDPAAAGHATRSIDD